jgi:hypothetical protein
VVVIDARVVVQKWTLQDPCHPPPIALHDVYYDLVKIDMAGAFNELLLLL